LNKLCAYNLQDLGHDTVDANLLLGRESDERAYDLAALLLRADLRQRAQSQGRAKAPSGRSLIAGDEASDRVCRS
jgi:hypothetical protein